MPTRKRPDFDLVVMGGGPAGLAAAQAAAAAGARVALIEKRLLGGTSLLTGTVPSKAMLRPARLYAFLRDAAGFGATVPEDSIRPDFPAAMHRLRRVRMRIGAYHSAERLRMTGIDVLTGAAHFTGHDAVEVSGRAIRFKRAIVATGARSSEVQIDGLRREDYSTSEEIFDLCVAPPRLLVIGGGPLGCELAQAFCRLGSQVIIAQNEAKFLPREERDAAQILSDSLARDGVEVHLNATIQQVVANPSGGYRVELVSDGQHHLVDVDHILAGVGRSPNVEDLGLDAAGIRFDREVGIKVDDFLRTSNAAVYAAGDVCLEHRYTHVAELAGRLAAGNALSRNRKRLSGYVIPWCTYTDPEIAHVGLYVDDARQQAIPFKTYSISMADVDRAIIDGQERGFIKLHIRDGSDELLGATIVAAHAGEMINQLTLAITAGVGLTQLAEVLHVYPSQAHAIKQAADAFVRSRVANAGRDPARPRWPYEGPAGQE